MSELSPRRGALLETNLKVRMVDTQKHLAALEAAVAAFPNEFDVDTFERAWSGSTEERLTTYPVQAGYENVSNGCIKIAQELSELRGWSPPNVEPNANEALKHLHNNGVITQKTWAALKDANEQRNDVQHDYVGTAARGIHSATLAVLEHAHSLLQNVAQDLRQGT